MEFDDDEGKESEVVACCKGFFRRAMGVDMIRGREPMGRGKDWYEP